MAQDLKALKRIPYANDYVNELRLAISYVVGAAISQCQYSDRDNRALSPTWLRNKVVVIVIVEEPPFIIKRGEDGKEEFEGFCIDLITELAKEVDFEFHLYTVDDGKYGSQDADGNWNGLVKDLMEDKADLALAPLTISSDRERAIDFTKPFMEYGTGLLIKKPPSEGRYLFAFLMPFQIVVWICILVALVCVGFMLYVTSRIRYMLRVGEPFDNDRAFTLRNSIWFAYWSLVKRESVNGESKDGGQPRVVEMGGEPAPRSLPIRILAGFWWLFALIVVSTYTANLTAFLTVKRLSSPIASLEDLAKQTEIAYGLEKDVFLYNFFREQDGTGSVFERMWHSMSADPNNFASSLNEGIEKVRDGNYVFMDDEPILEYLVANDENCELMLVGKPFLYRGYGIATQRGGHLLDKLSVQPWAGAAYCLGWRRPLRTPADPTGRLCADPLLTMIGGCSASVREAKFGNV
ncbi:hypothetical protein Bbelb_386990 [Branchiostoma belcheri]|nr:hypothetical protein Bbelb_386990 [Branchiostoma belcheri]